MLFIERGRFPKQILSKIECDLYTWIFVGGSDVTFVNSSKVIVRVESQVWFLNKLVSFSVMFLAA